MKTRTFSSCLRPGALSAFALAAMLAIPVFSLSGPVLAQTAKSEQRLDLEMHGEEGAAPDAAVDGVVTSTPEADPRSEIDALLDALSRASDAETASRIEQSVLQVWMVSGSDTIDLLMNRAVIAIETKQYPIALELLDAIIELKPDYVEAWNKRATLFYLIDDYDRSMRDIRQVLAREPRHFGALSGLGLILQEVGQKKGALSAFREAMSVHPFLENVQDSIKELVRDVEGDEI